MYSWWSLRRSRLATFVLMMVGAWLLQATLAAQLPSGLPAHDDWGAWFRDNAFTVVLFAFHMGVSWREFLDHKRQIEKHDEKLEAIDKRFELLSETYAQNRVMDAVQEELLRRFDNLERRIGVPK